MALALRASGLSRRKCNAMKIGPKPWELPVMIGIVVVTAIVTRWYGFY